MKYTRENIVGIEFKANQPYGDTYTICSHPSGNVNAVMITGSKFFRVDYEAHDVINHLNSSRWQVINKNIECYEVY